MLILICAHCEEKYQLAIATHHFKKCKFFKNLLLWLQGLLNRLIGSIDRETIIFKGAAIFLFLLTFALIAIRGYRKVQLRRPFTSSTYPIPRAIFAVGV